MLVFEFLSFVVVLAYFNHGQNIRQHGAMPDANQRDLIKMVMDRNSCCIALFGWPLFVPLAHTGIFKTTYR